MKKVKMNMSRTFEFDKFICDEYMLETHFSVYPCVIHIEFNSMCISFRDELVKELEECFEEELQEKDLIVTFDTTIPIDYFAFKEFEKILAPEI